jgi:hypothetical protein
MDSNGAARPQSVSQRSYDVVRLLDERQHPPARCSIDTRRRQARGVEIELVSGHVGHAALGTPRGERVKIACRLVDGNNAT